MASIVDAFSESLSDNFSYLKFVLYAIPVFLCANSYMKGEMTSVNIWVVVVGLLLFALLTEGIHLVRNNSATILSLNPANLLKALIKSAAVLLPQAGITCYIGYLLVTKVTIPIDLPYVPVIFKSIVWAIIGSYVFTAYLSFARNMKISDGFNLAAISASCVDVFVALLFFVPQLAISALVIVGPVAYMLWFFKISLSHFGFVAYCSVASIMLLSICANYFAQISGEQIKGLNESFEGSFDSQFANEEYINKRAAAMAGANKNIQSEPTAFQPAKGLQPKEHTDSENADIYKHSINDDESIPNVRIPKKNSDGTPDLNTNITQKSDSERFSELNSKIQEKFAFGADPVEIPNVMPNSNDEDSQNSDSSEDSNQFVDLNAKIQQKFGAVGGEDDSFDFTSIEDFTSEDDNKNQ